MSAAEDRETAIDELTQEYAVLTGEQPRYVRLAIAELVEAYGVDVIRKSMVEYCAIGAAIENEKFAEKMGWNGEEGDQS